MSSFNPPPGATSPYAAGGSIAPPPKKSNGLKIVLIILGVLGVGSLLCCGGVYFAGQWGIGQVGEMIGKALSAELQGNPTLEKEIGTIESLTWNIMKSGKETQDRDEQNLIVFDVKGSKGSGEIICKIKQGGGDEPTITWAKLRKPDGTEVDLISDGPEIDMGSGSEVESESPF